MVRLDVKWEKTGEHRPPMTGEWFFGDEGNIVQAMFDFAATSFDIARMITTEVEEDKSQEANV